MRFETSPASIAEAICFLDELLDPGAFDGLRTQRAPGARRRDPITKVVTGVSAQRELIERAVALEAGLVLVHHGLFWDFLPTGLTPTLAERVRPLFKHDIALAAYHLPLDAHPEVGNNALLAGLLGCERHTPFAEIGRLGEFGGDGLPASELFARVERVTSARRWCSTPARSGCAGSASSPARRRSCSRRRWRWGSTRS